MITYIIMTIVAIFHLTLDMWVPMSEMQLMVSSIVGNIWLAGSLIVLSMHNE